MSSLFYDSKQIINQKFELWVKYVAYEELWASTTRYAKPCVGVENIL